LLEKLVVETEETGKQFLSHVAQVSVKDPQTLLINVFDLNVASNFFFIPFLFFSVACKIDLFILFNLAGKNGGRECKKL